LRQEKSLVSDYQIKINAPGGLLRGLSGLSGFSVIQPGGLLDIQALAPSG
jgi:hypothetical protein